MKRILGIVLAVSLIAGGLVSCATASSGGGGSSGGGSSGGGLAAAPVAAAPVERKVPGGFPDFVKKALMNVPEDAFVGVGTAKLASVSQSMTIAQTRARADISRQISSVIKDMVNDYTASSEVDPKAAVSFQETITQALSKSKLSGASVVEIDSAADGSVWCVVQMSKNDVGKEINQEANQAKLKAPAMAAFDALGRMDKAFDKIAGEEVQAVSN